MSNIFMNGGGAGIGSFVVVFKDGAMDPATDLRALRGAYDAGDSIFFSIVEEGTSEALVPASGWVDGESKMHLVARDFDDERTYKVELGLEAHEPEVEVSDSIVLGEGELPDEGMVNDIAEQAAADAAAAVKVEFEGEHVVIPEQEGEIPERAIGFKHGDAIVPMMDARLPEADAEDEGKALKVNAEGEYELGAAGVRIYNHNVVMKGMIGEGEHMEFHLMFASNSDEPTSVSEEEWLALVIPGTILCSFIAGYVDDVMVRLQKVSGDRYDVQAVPEFGSMLEDLTGVDEIVDDVEEIR